MTSRRRKIAGSVAALALAGGLVLAGTIAAHANGGLEFNETSADTITVTYASDGYQISGSTDDPGAVELRFGTHDALGGPICTDTPLGTSWLCNVTIPAGTYAITAVQADPLHFDDVTLVVNYPAVSVDPGPYNVVAGESVTISGTTTYPNVTIQVTTSSPVGSCSVPTPIVAASTPWSCELTADDDVSGAFDLYVTQLESGNPIGTYIGPGELVISPGSAGPLEITSPGRDTDNDWSAGGIPISGTADTVGSTINVYKIASGTSGSPDPVSGCLSVVVQPDNTWSCFGVLTPGEWDLTATSIDGSDGVRFVRVLIPAPAIDDADPRHVVEPGAPTDTTFSGTTTYQGTASSYIQVYFPTSGVPHPGSGALCASSITWDAIASIGTWSCDIDLADQDLIADATYTYTVHQEDLGALPFRTDQHTLVYGNDYAASLDITSPGNDNEFIWREVPSVTVTGVAPSGDPVSVLLDGSVPAGCGGVPVDYTGAWTCNLPVLSLGGHTIVAQQLGGAVESLSVGFDVVLPAPGISGSTAFVFTDGAAYDYLGGTAEPGTRVRAVVVNVGTSVEVGVSCETTTSYTGDWYSCYLNYEPLAPGDYEILVTQRPDGAPIATHGDAAILSLRIVSVPAPVVTSPRPYTLPADDVARFTGTTSYLDGTVWVEIVTDTSPYTTVVCSDPGPFTLIANTWACNIDASALASGAYAVHVFIEDVIDDEYVYSDSVDFYLYVDVPTGTPDIDCGFSPNGGVSISSPYVMSYMDLGLVYTYGGSSFGDTFAFPGYCNGVPTSPLPFDDGNVWVDPIADCVTGCSQSGLAPGLYVVDYSVSDISPVPGVSYEDFSFIFVIPTAPVITSVASTTNSVVMSGTAEPGVAVRIQRATGGQLCATTANGSGAWACQFVKSNANTARAIAVDPTGGMSAYSANRTIPIATLPVTGEPPTALVSWFLEFGGDLSNLKPGDKFTLNVSGMPVGTEIEVWMHSDPYLLGTATGTGLPIAMNLQVPEDIESGPHEIEMIAVTPLGTNYFYTSDANVSGGAPAVGDKPLDTPEDPKADGIGSGDGSGSGSGSGSGGRDDPGAPSGITGTIAPLQAIVDNPAAIAIAGGLALALLFLVALPTELLNSSLSSNTSRLGRAYGAFDNAMTRAQNWLVKVTHSRAVVAILLVLIVAFIYGFVDPGFGFDIVSLRLVLSLAIAFFLLSFVASWVSGMIIRRAWGAMAVVALQPSIILFAVVGVIVARVLDFSPGFLVGVAIGLELLQASKHVSARAVFVQIAVVTGFSLAAWIVYSLFTPGHDFLGLLVEDTMVATTAEGLTGALIAVFPLKFLDGRELWEVSKRLWAAAFLIVGTAFALLVLPTAIQGTDVADFGTWLIVFAIFGGISFAVWLIFVRADKRASTVEKPKVDA